MITISIYSRDIDPISTKPSQFQMKNKTNKQTNKNLQQFCSTRVKPLANLAARWSYSSLDTFRKQNLKIISVRLADLWSCVRGPIPVQTSSRKKKKKKTQDRFQTKTFADEQSGPCKGEGHLFVLSIQSTLPLSKQSCGKEEN
jgi:hypothetical protein